jgi:hypothetical protein
LLDTIFDRIFTAGQLGLFMVGFIERLVARTKTPASAARLNTPHPPYWLGEEWTPTLEQVDAARLRQAARRAKTKWRRLGTGPELDVVRTAIVCATSLQHERDRLLRSIVFDESAEFFVRDLVVNADRYLIEFRHPLLQIKGAPAPVGVRFLGLTQRAWRRQDHVGVILDGSLPPDDLFGQQWFETFHDANLAEAYVRFLLDNAEFKGNQFYVISDRQDFIACTGEFLDNKENFAAVLSAQYRVSMPPAVEGGGEEKQDALWGILNVPESALVPPTMLRTIPAVDKIPEQAVVFSTVIHLGRVHYICLKVSADGKIDLTAERTSTPEEVSLPLVPLRSFAEQRTRTEQAIRASAGDAAEFA